MDCTSRQRSVTPAHRLTVAADIILGVQPVELARWVADTRTKARAAFGTLDRALADPAPTR